MLLRVSSGLSSIEASCPEYISGPAKTKVYSKLKRLSDLVVVLGSAPAVLLVLLIASAAIYLVEGRPIFFAQDRVGRGGLLLPTSQP